MIGHLLARLVLAPFGMTPEPEPLPTSEATWRCPTCGHTHTRGFYRLGRIVGADRAAIDDYLDDRIDAAELDRRLGEAYR